VSVRTLLRTRREVWRTTTVPDGLGGFTTVTALAGTVRCKVDSATANERESGGQWSAEHTHSVFAVPSADIRRGDEIRGGRAPLRVLAVVEPSSPVYIKAICAADEPGS
jgi:head-tail joining protein